MNFKWIVLFFGLAGLCGEAGAQGYGIQCNENLNQSLAAAQFSEKSDKAVRATCAFWDKITEFEKVFTSGWPDRMLPLAQRYFKEAEELADKSATAHFETQDPRSQYSMKIVYMRLGRMNRWLDQVTENIEKKKGGKNRRSTPSSGYDSGYQPPRQGLSNRGIPCHVPSERMLGGC